MSVQKLLLGTRNLGKQDELLALLSGQNLEVVMPQDLGLAIRVEETGASYGENARLKAVAYATQSGLWTLSDDSGLEVDVLNGAPGLRSSRLAGEGKSDLDRRRLLLGMLKNHARPWEARFRATVALSDPSGEVELAEGQCAGEIIDEERGAGGFGYDPIFMVHETGKTMAELEMREKNRLSHRARAFEAIRLLLDARLGLSG